MKTEIQFNSIKYIIDLSKPIDISIPLRNGESVNAFHIPDARFEPIRIGNFVGSVREGGSANCENLFINAHGNGTHTECLGHISKERVCINDCLKHFHFMAKLLSVSPKQHTNGDTVITADQINLTDIPDHIEALIIRTLPNIKDKLTKKYSGNNPCYLDPVLCKNIRGKGIKHLLIDLPSVDREEDGGELAAHHAFWNYPENPQYAMTITEMVFIPDTLADGEYFLNLQIASFESDASPSKPVLYDVSAL